MVARLDKARIERIASLVEQEIPLDKWPEELFLAEDNIQKPGQLLDNAVEPGAALVVAIEKGFDAIYYEIDRSELRGRGGAGFQTSWKWKFCFEGPEELAVCPMGKPKHVDRYVVCNADEGEPGTFKDRVLLNSHADQVFEGMTVCAAIIGATQGFLYLRGEYLYLREKLRRFWRTPRDRGLLGQNILNQGLDFDIEICIGARALIYAARSRR